MKQIPDHDVIKKCRINDSANIWWEIFLYLSKYHGTYLEMIYENGTIISIIDKRTERILNMKFRLMDAGWSIDRVNELIYSQEFPDVSNDEGGNYINGELFDEIEEWLNIIGDRNEDLNSDNH